MDRRFIMFGRRNIRDAYSGMPSNFVGVLDGMASAPRAAYSCFRALLVSYSGPLIRVRKTSGGDTTTEHDVPQTASRVANLVDLAAFVGAESWVIVTIYDQTTGARHLTIATTTKQPKGGTTGTAVPISGNLAGDYDGTDDQLSRADALGLSGAIAMSIWMDATFDNTTVRIPIGLGADSVGGTAFILAVLTSTSYRISIKAATRDFTATAISGRQRLIFRIAAGAGVGTSRLMQNGSELPELASANPANTMTLGTDFTGIGTYPGQILLHDGGISEAAFWNADLSAGDLAQVNAA
jgi:hypothetical protein